MPSTTNFGWTTPADTDLVKDGAAAIRTLGNGVDSSFVDLKGGTTGQILSKNSATDLDFVWIANDQGDITAVTAGTGISGGGTSGAVTITNSMATEITAKGDLIVGTGNAAFDNLPAGTNGYVLTADSTVSPTGLKWAAPAGGGSLIFINKTTASAASTVSIDGVFSSTYKNYVVIFTGKNNGAGVIELKGNFRTSGSTNTNSNYTSQVIYGSGTTVAGDATSNAAAFRRFGYLHPQNQSMNWKISNPADTEYTGFSYDIAGADSSSMYVGSGRFTNTTAFDGIIIQDNGGTQTLTGTLFVYGVKES